MGVAEGDKIVDAQRFAVIVPLHKINVLFLQEAHLFCGFHALRHGLHFEFFGQ
ncbi:hypothetical protein D3C78_1852690 [compost metagenome]